MKRLIAVLSGLLVLPAFAEVVPAYYYEELAEFSDDYAEPETTEEEQQQTAISLPDTTYSDMEVTDIYMEYLDSEDQTMVSMSILNTTSNLVENESLNAILIGADGNVLGQMQTRRTCSNCHGTGEVIETETTNKQTYTVKSGDTLYSIARTNNITVDELKELNNLTTNLLSVGQTLLIPNTTSTSKYIVQKGDTLYSIANKFNTTVDNLKELNNLSSNTLSIGQELLI